MENNKNEIKERIINVLDKMLSFKGMMATATIGVWILVLQNFGIIPISQNVNVENTVDISGSVDAKVSGSVDVDNTVDINVSAINGYRNCFYDNTNRHPKQYYRIPVFEY